MTTVGTVLAHRYRLVQRVATGGMGLVWEGWDELLQRPVAIKQLLVQPGLSDEQVKLARNRVIREARLTARLHHPNAVTLYDVIDDAGHPCLIMQWVPSRSLSTVLLERGTLQPTEVAGIGAQLAAALAAAHAVGIVHRDVKPSNVLITADGSAMLSDFGISHAVGDVTLTANGIISGTPAYLAPEVARGGSSGFAADVFSLGATIYAALEGTPPFGSDANPMALLHRAASGQVTPPEHAGSLTPLLLRMLALQPEHRPRMLQVAEQLSDGHVVPPTLAEVTQPAITAQTIRETPTDPAAAEGGPAGGYLDLAPRSGTESAVPDHRRRTVPTLLTVAMAALVATALVVGSVLLLNRGTDEPGDLSGTQQTTTRSSPSGTHGAQTTSGSPSAEIGTKSAGAVGPSPTNVSWSSRSTPGTVPPPSTPSSTEQSLQARPPTSRTAATRSAGSTTAARTPTAEPSHSRSTPTTDGSTATAGASTTAPADGTGVTARTLVAALTDYYDLMPTNTDEGWQRLTPKFQNGIAQNRQYYESFWGRIDRVTLEDPAADGPDTVEATVTYYFSNGEVSEERTLFRLVSEGGQLKIDDSTVLSASTR